MNVLVVDFEVTEDGAVEFRSIDGTEKGKPMKEKEYAAMKVADDVFLVSSLALTF